MNSSVVRYILQTLVGAPTSQLLFLDNDREYNYTFPFREYIDNDYSCIYTNDSVVNVFVNDKDDYTSIHSDNEIVYPSVIAITWNLNVTHYHVGTLICLSPNEIYYIDYYQEMKRNIKDPRTYGLNYFLFRMTINDMHHLFNSNPTDILYQFLGCNPRIVQEDNSDLDDDITFNMEMYTNLHSYNTKEQFLDQLQLQVDMITEIAKINPTLITECLISRVNSAIPLASGETYEMIQSRIERNPIDIDFITDRVLRAIDHNYKTLLDDMNLIDYDLEIVTYYDYDP